MTLSPLIFSFMGQVLWKTIYFSFIYVFTYFVILALKKFVFSLWSKRTPVPNIYCIQFKNEIKTKKCSTDQRLIRKRNTTYKKWTLVKTKALAFQMRCKKILSQLLTDLEKKNPWALLSISICGQSEQSSSKTGNKYLRNF